VNAILTGTNRHYYVPDFEGCISIKSVVSGSAMWETNGRKFVVHENNYLILNDRQRYTITMESALPSTTFCLFFKRGLVEDVFRTSITRTTKLLDSPHAPPSVNFWERLETHEDGVLELMRSLRTKLNAASGNEVDFEEDFYRVAAQILKIHLDLPEKLARLPAVRAATREELFRRLLLGRDFILSSLDSRISLNNIASVACLSPFHFHRAFTRTFGETPHQYLTRHRLERACYLLRQNGHSILEICLDCGFESPGTFSSLFKRHFGLSPKAFQKQMSL
jgi:AraC-like DNA-binding protein